MAHKLPIVECISTLAHFILSNMFYLWIIIIPNSILHHFPSIVNMEIQKFINTIFINTNRRINTFHFASHSSVKIKKSRVQFLKPLILLCHLLNLDAEKKRRPKQNALHKSEKRIIPPLQLLTSLVENIWVKSAVASHAPQQAGA